MLHILVARTLRASPEQHAAGPLLGSDHILPYTGGGRGIGSEVAKSFAREGATIALVARTEDQLQEVCANDRTDL